MVFNLPLFRYVFKGKITFNLKYRIHMRSIMNIPANTKYYVYSTLPAIALEVMNIAGSALSRHSFSSYNGLM